MFKKSATYICILLAGIVGIFGVNITNHGTIEWWVMNTYAADPCSWPNPPIPCANAGTQDAKMQEMLQWLVNGLKIILDILTIIVSPAIILASWLMSPDWTSGDLFQIRPMIHQLWIVVSNVTYFIYAILLIFIAMATIFNSDKYGYKQLLPKLALGIIMVPLSWWFIQFIISLASLVTASVISIPSEVVINYNKNNAESWWTTPSIPKETVFNNKLPGPSKPCAPLVWPPWPNEQECISPETFIQKSWGMYSSLMIYSFAVFRFQDVKMLNSTTEKVVAIWQIINQWLIGAIMFIAYGLLVMALIFMLFVRAIKLWFYAIFSPFMTLKFVLWDSMFKDNNDSFDLKEFVGLAFVPAIVGLALSFWLIIVSVMLKPPSSVTPGCDTTECKIILFGNAENTITTKTEDVSGGKQTKTTATVAGASYTFIGDVTSWNTTGNVMSALNMAWGIIGTIIIDIIALVFIWVAFMAAKGVSKVAATAFAPFEDMGKKIASIPKYIPIPFTGGMSAAGMQKIPGLVEDGFRKRSDDKFDGSFWGRLKREWAGWGSSADVAKLREADHLDGRAWVEATKMARESIHAAGSGEKMFTDSEMRKFTDRFAEKIKDDKIKMEDLQSKYGDKIWKELYEMAKKGPLSDSDRKIFDARLSGNQTYSLTSTDAEKWMKDKSKATSNGWNTWNTFTADKVVWDDSKIRINFNDQNIQFSIKDGSYSDKDKDNLVKMISWLTEEEFRKKSAWVSSTITDKIIKDMAWKFKDPSKATEAPPPAAPNPATTPKAP